MAAILGLPGSTARGLGTQPDAPLGGALRRRGVEEELPPPVAPVGAGGVLVRSHQQPPRSAPRRRRRRRRGGGAVVPLVRGSAALRPRPPRRAAPPPLHGCAVESTAAFHPIGIALGARGETVTFRPNPRTESERRPGTQNWREE